MLTATGLLFKEKSLASFFPASAMQPAGPVGNGVIDFKRIFANASTAGMKHFFVEHDMPADPITSITTSINYLKKLLG